MNELGIHTTIELNPCANSFMDNCTTIVRGTTAELIFDLSNYPYLTPEILKQVTFILKWDNGHFEYFTWPEDLEVTSNKNCHFHFEDDYTYLVCTLPTEFTRKMMLADIEAPVQCEAVITIYADTIPDNYEDVDKLEQSTIIERQAPIVIVDSLYAELCSKEGA